jgi:sirohydrochlorin cobaltochelatase
MIVEFAFTSCRKPQAHDRRDPSAASMAEVLDRLRDRGVQRVALAPLYIVPGLEYTAVARQAEEAGHQGAFVRVTVARPLLSDAPSVSRAADAVLDMLPRRPEPGEAAVLMGHGSPAPGNELYAALQTELTNRSPRVLLGTMDHAPGIDRILERLEDLDVRLAWLVPLMTVAGCHARRDMAGSGPGSWKSIIERRGIDCRVFLTGVMEHESFEAIWLDNLKLAVAQMKTPGP